MTYNSLAPNVRLPYNIVKGTVAQRREKVINCVDKLYKDLYPKFVHGKVSVADIQKSVDKVIGAKGKVHVIKNPPNMFDEGGQDVLFSDFNGKLSAITLEMDTKEKFFKFPDLITILHEFSHVADMFFHPKYTARYQYMASEGLYFKKYDKLYEDIFYHEEKPLGRRYKAKRLRRVEYKLLNFLKKVPKEDRMEYIQDIRYCLTSEAEAYKTQLKYARILDRKHHPVKKGDLNDECDTFLFDEKLKIVNHVASVLIQKEQLKMKKGPRVNRKH